MPVYQQINEKMLQVTLSNEEVFARKGAMVSYQGDVQFSRSFLAGQGVQSLAMRAVTSEGYALMLAKGSGSVYYAQGGLFVTIIPVRGETLYVESDSLLAFDARLTAGTMFLGNQGGIQGMVRGAVSGQGLFTTTLQGTGEVAILSDGNAIGLPVTPDVPVFVDPQAYIGHVGQLSSSIVTDLNWKTFVGQASGESYQVKFMGQGTVYIQASER
ncbi:AIM24 family protein [Janthinobacterium aquaticum]|uniref:AIM24 family protein n=1 Tax=Janthinobacterium sp. FT58W TaxID=2654254 RepID=UPI001265861B|nr:AIM24 family protein [Janthinobacterium sp. FT58W]KAB8042103.1 AIM24 family protein [Janthinobacterium sp. FT58W]